MRFIVMDSGLFGQYGHHDHFARGLRNTLGAQNIPFRYLALTSVDAAVQQSCGAEPFFTRYHYDRLSHDRFDFLVQDFRKRRQAFLLDLDRLDEAAIAPNDVILLATGTSSEIVALVTWLQKKRLKNRVACIVYRLTPFSDADFSAGSQLLSLWRDVFRCVRGIDPDRLWIGAMTDRLSQRLETVLERPVVPISSVQWVSPDAALTQGPRGPRTRVAFLGQARASKGLPLVQGLVDHVRQSEGPLHLVIQWSDDDVGASCQTDPCVEHLEGWVDDQAMEVLVNGIDIIALPYVGGPARHSGIFTLGCAMGRPFVVPRGSWMATQIEAGHAAGVIYADQTPKALLEALLQAHNDIKALQNLAMDCAPAWRTRRSGDGLVRSLVDWARQ